MAKCNECNGSGSLKCFTCNGTGEEGSGAYYPDPRDLCPWKTNKVFTDV